MLGETTGVDQDNHLLLGNECNVLEHLRRQFDRGRTFNCLVGNECNVAKHLDRVPSEGNLIERDNNYFESSLGIRACI